MTLVSKAHESHASYFMQNATRLMREHFLTPDSTIDLQIIQDILHHSFSEWYRGNNNAAMIHLRILAGLAQAFDFSKLADRSLFENGCCFAVYISIETGEAPILPLSWEPKKLSLNQMSEINHHFGQLLDRPQGKALWDPFRKMKNAERLLGVTTGPFTLLGQRPTEEGLCAGHEVVGLARRPVTGFAEALADGLFDPPMRDIVADFTSHLEILTYHSACSDLGRTGITFVGKKSLALI